MLTCSVQLTCIDQKHSIVIMQVRVVWTILYAFTIYVIGFRKASLWKNADEIMTGLKQELTPRWLQGAAVCATEEVLLIVFHSYLDTD